MTCRTLDLIALTEEVEASTLVVKIRSLSCSKFAINSYFRISKRQGGGAMILPECFLSNQNSISKNSQVGSANKTNRSFTGNQ